MLTDVKVRKWGYSEWSEVLSLGTRNCIISHFNHKIFIIYHQCLRKCYNLDDILSLPKHILRKYITEFENVIQEGKEETYLDQNMILKYFPKKIYIKQLKRHNIHLSLHII